MKYILRKDLDGAPEIEISEESYTTYKEARAILSNCLAIEENYEILISNYIDLKKQILEAATTRMMRVPSGYSDFFDVQLALNIRMVNLLTSARLYLDYLPQHVKECIPHNDAAKTLVKSILAKEYDENYEYRFMEELRNSVQHCGLPVQWTYSGAEWTDLGKDGISENSMLEYSFEFAAKKSSLEEDVKFKRKVLNESPDEIDLKLTTRCYIESISKAHDAIRELIQKSVQKSRQKLEDAHSQYSKVYTESLLGLSAYKIDGQRCIETVLLMLDWDNVRVMLQKRNLKLVNLRKWYVTGKIKKI